MKKIYFLPFCFLALLMTVNSNAQLIISSNTTWSTDQIITQDVIINAGVTLTINQGVKVEAVYVDGNLDGIGDIDITVNGKMVTLGTQCDPVVFRPFGAPNDSSEHWNGIIINSATNNDSLHFFTLEYAYSSLDIQTDATVKGVNIYSCPTGITIDTTASVTIEECFLHDNEGTGVVNYGGTLTINNCHIYNNPKYGVATMGGVLVMGFSDVDSNSWGGIYIGGTANIDIQNCEVIGNSGAAMEVSDMVSSDDFRSYAFSDGEPTLYVTNNNIYGNASSTFTISVSKTMTMAYIPATGTSCTSGTILSDNNGPTWEIPMGWITSYNFLSSRNTSPSWNYGAYYLKDGYTNAQVGYVMHGGGGSGCGGGYNQRASSYPITAITDRYYNMAHCGTSTVNWMVRSISCNITTGGYEVFSTVAADTSMDFTGNYWGQIIGVDTLMHNLLTPDIEYSGYLTAEIQNIGTSISSGLPIVQLGNDTTICDSVTLTLDANNPGETYLWSTTATTQTISVLNTPGTYLVTVTNSCGSKSDSIVISNSPWPGIPATPTGQTTLCQDYLNTNYITSGGTNATSYAWSIFPINAGVTTGTSTTGTVDWDASFNGTAKIYVSGVNSCGTGNTDSIIVTVNGLPTATISGNTGICIGDSTVLTASGGLSYVWNTGPTTASITVTPVVSTTYNVTVTDGNACDGSTTIMVTVAAPPVADAGSGATICEGASTTLSASGGTNYSWSPTTGLSNPNISNPVASPTTTTTYIVSVDNGGCTAQDSVVVTVNTAPAANAGADVAICIGLSTTLSASGGVSYSWNPTTGLSNPNIANPVANPTTTTTYTVLVTDGIGCTDTDPVVITVNSATANAGADVAICSGSTTTLSASGGVSYSWSPTTGLSNPNIANPIASPTATTTYTITVTDGNSCTDSDPVVVTVNALPTANAGADISICNGSSTTLSASGGTSYSWSPTTGLSNPNIANPVASPTTTTTYTITVTDGNSCTDSDPVIVTVNTLPTANAGTDVTICSGSSTSLSATGGVNYSWSPATGLSNPNIANPVASPTATTIYTVTVTDGNSCTDTDPITVTVNSLPTANAGADVSICNGSNTTLTASGGVSYSWSPSTGLSNAGISNPVASPATTTTYTVTVTDGNGCTDTDPLVVTVNAATANAGVDVSICNGSSTTLSASGGVSYSWSPATGLSSTTSSTPVANPTATTTYTVTVTDGNGCTGTDDVNVIVNTPPTANAGSDVIICNGSSTNLSATGGTTYSWSPTTGLNNSSIANPVASPTSTITYTVTVTDGNGCSANDAVIVSVNPAPPANAGGDVSICIGTSTTLSASGGTGYTWSPSTGLSNVNIANPTANPTVTITYTVTVTDGNGCTATDDVIVTVNSVTASAGSDVSICIGSSVTLAASGGVSYLWSPSAGLSSVTVANPVASPTSTTTYTVTVTDANSCTASDDVLVTVNNLPIISAGADVTICEGETTALSASGGASYNWSPSTGLSSTTVANPVASPASSITYTVTGTDANGCSGTDDVVVTVNSTPVVSAGADVSICDGESTALAATGGNSYVWSTGANTTTITVSPSATTTYTVTGTDANNCSGTDDVIVTVNPNPTAPVIIQGGNVLSTNLASTYQWFLNGNPISGANGQFHTALSSGFYTVEITDNNGCTAVSSPLDVTVVGIHEVEAGISIDLFPNPNRGVFTLEIQVMEVQDIEIKITNVIGQEVLFEKLTQIKGTYQKEIDLKGYSPGVYQLQLITNNGIIDRRIVIE